MRRDDLGRDAFVDAVWQWRNDYGARIEGQIQRLGALVCWDRAFFTLDEDRSAAVDAAFVEMFDRGMIYRAMRLVNWSPALRTALSDLEVDLVEVQVPTEWEVPAAEAPVVFGQMYHVEFKVHGSDDVVHGDEEEEEMTIVVSTTRPETMLGDVAIAVHSGDVRYAGVRGKWAVHPITGGRLPIVVDDELVDPEVGSGAVKITPAHDEADWQCGQRLGLPHVEVFTEDGRMNARCGKYAGMHRFDCRREIVADLSAMGALKSVDAFPMRVPVCSRSGDVVEPMLKPQWYVRCGDMAKKAMAAVEDGHVGMSPMKAGKTWNRWLADIQDWCVSRQLWWGHRVPAYRVVGDEDGDGEEKWVAAMSEADAVAKAGGRGVERDEDVLDTWFSSALLPLSCAGWPGTVDEEIYPLDVMETGQDILFFWVARMVMLCSELHPHGTAPFKQVLLHPMVRDAQGRKMSKSLGNVIDPLDVLDGISRDDMLAKIEQGNLDTKEATRAKKEILERYDPEGIPACGADALRLALAGYLEQTDAIHMDVQQVVTWKRFCNKLWNAVAFCLKQLETVDLDCSQRSAGSTVEQKWIVSRLHACIETCTHAFDESQISVVTHAIRAFIYDELCGVYLESCKPGMNGHGGRESHLRTLHYCLDQILRLLHPIAPFITEDLWHRLNKHEVASTRLVDESFPDLTETAANNGMVRDIKAEEEMEIVLQTVQGVRSLRERILNDLKRYGLTPVISVDVDASKPNVLQILQDNQGLLQRLLRLPSSEMPMPITQAEPNAHALVHPCYGGCIAIQADLALADPEMDQQTIDASLAKVQQRESKLKKQLASADRVLSSTGFVHNAPASKVQAQYVKRAQLQSEIEAVGIIRDTFLRWAERNRGNPSHR